MDELEFETAADLGELIERDRSLFQEICESYVEAYQVAV